MDEEMNEQHGSNSPESWQATISFSTLIWKYVALQSKVVSSVRALASNISQATPGQFLLLQFQMAQVTQIGDSISNLVAQINQVIGNAVQNQKTR